MFLFINTKQVKYRMVKFRGFQSLTFQPHLYPKILNKDLQHIKQNTLIQDFNIEQLLQEGKLQQQNKKHIYLYKQQYKGHISLGLLGQLSIKDYKYKRIKKHEETLERENLNCDTIAENYIAPVVVGHHFCQEVDNILERIAEQEKPFAKWKTVDGRKHALWRIKQCQSLRKIYSQQIQDLYILDGHHRFEASAQFLEKQGANASESSKWILGIVYSNKYIKVHSQYRELVDDKREQIIKKIMNDPKVKVTEIEKFTEQSLNDQNIILLYDGKCYDISEAKINPQKGTQQDQSSKTKTKNKQCKKQSQSCFLGVQLLSKILSGAQQNKTDNRSNKKMNTQQKQVVGNQQSSKKEEKQSKDEQQNSSEIPSKEQIKIQYLPAILFDLDDKQEMATKKNPIFIVKPPTIQTVFSYGDNQKVLPPKSTWLQPKPCLHMVIRMPN